MTETPTKKILKIVQFVSNIRKLSKKRASKNIEKGFVILHKNKAKICAIITNRNNYVNLPL